jgi:hypothetical protein
LLYCKDKVESRRIFGEMLLQPLFNEFWNCTRWTRAGVLSYPFGILPLMMIIYCMHP